MKNILFICRQKELKDDLDIAATMGIADYDYELHTTNELSKLDSAVKSYHPDMVVIYSDIIGQRDSWELGVKTVYCAKSRDDLNKYASYGLDTIGIAKDSEEILEKLASDPYPVKKTAKPAAAAAPKQPQNAEKEKEKPAKNKKETKPERKPEIIDIDTDDDKTDEEVLDGFEDIDDEEEKPVEKPKANKSAKKEEKKVMEELPVLEEDDDEDDFDELNFFDKQEDYEEDIDTEEVDDNSEDTEEADAEEADTEEDTPEVEEEKVIQKEKQNKKQDKKRIEKRKPEKKQEEKRDVIQERFEKDVKGNRGDTKVIAVYSAKGGVGKTTIASELALYLSMVENGPRKLRVCIVDYNIDFGDVKATLGMEQTRKSITYWADEVKEFLDKGYDPESIVYSKDEIEAYLDRNSRSGLWVLPAPFTNEDSMGIDSEELRVIIRNLIEYGEFDYIICDTGNNTRDSTMIALENADIILMIMTQNINTANCDMAFLDTMRMIDFDLSNTKLIVNNILPIKMAAISVEEILDYFKQFECVGKINYNPDVIKATNVGEPLAFDPSHEFTKQMKEIVAFILNDKAMKAEIEEPQKKSLFGFLKRKKKK